MKKVLKSCISLLLAACLVLGVVPATMLTAYAAADDGKFDYVSIGASNTNGYGMRGYITEEELELMLSGQVSKDDVNVYGYQRTPEGAYPDLIRDYYTGVYGEGNVTVNQLAISSMRVEELRILLDDTYMGDDYSSWRFTGSDGWFLAAEEGGLDALRAAYKESIANAELVTVDIGWNNFGVYVCNQLVDYMSNGRYKWTTDINSIFNTDAEKAAAQQAKELIRGYIEENVGSGDMANALTDIFAYSILGYVHNFDIVMEKIYELNPDVDVVIVGIQNLLHGAVVDMKGTKFPLGDVFGNFVNMANYYASACSPYQSRYQYVKAGTYEHVNIFLDYMKTYDGDAENLDQNVKDCFDYYDNDLFIQTRLDYIAAAMIEDEYGALLPNFGYESGEQVVAAGKKNELGNLQAIFDEMYWPALNAAYDTLAVLVREIANLEYVDANNLLAGGISIGAMEDALADAIMAEVQENALAAADGQEYTVDLDKMLPDSDAEIVAAMYIRYYMGNSFFAHPDATGHAEIKNAVLNVVNNPESEIDQKISDYLAASVHQIHQMLCSAAGHEFVNGVCPDCGASDSGSEPEKELFELYGANMILGNNLAMNFYIETADIEAGEDYYAVITKENANGENLVITIQDENWQKYSDKYYRITLEQIAAKEMADEVTVVIYNDEGEAVSKAWEDSVRKYAMRMLKNEEAKEAPNAEQLALYVEILNYGAAAQEHFKYNASDLANNQLTEAQKAYGIANVEMKDTRVKGEGYYGTSLTLESNILMNFYFNNIPAEHADMYAIASFTDHYGKAQQIKIEGEEFEKFDSTTWKIAVAGLAVADCRQQVEVKVYDASGAVIASVADSIESYTARKNGDGPLFIAIMKFAVAAYNSFH